MDGFAPSPRATLSLLRKLDYCFASLLGGEDLETKEVLPGFERGGLRAGLSRTDMVRCRSIAEQSRIATVDVFQRGPPDPLDENDSYYHSQARPSRADREGTAGTEASTVERGEDRETTAEPTDDDATTSGDNYDDGDEDDDDDDDIDGDVQMGVARVYEFTLVKLGEVLGNQHGRIGDFEPPSMALDDENDDED